jgi:hypothetical protein
MPAHLKHAHVKPLLKKPGLEVEMKNFRPVSNLSFLGKIIESAVINQYTNHLCQNQLNDNKQSAYKKYHSTETLLLKIQDDIISSISRGEVTMLVLLDLSAAFDTIDHNILIHRLQSRYGVDGTALEWFKSYVSDRSQLVTINDTLSDMLPLKFGVPQGSKLGPILFNSYIAPVSEMADKNKVNDEKYADDQQLILSFKPTFTDQEEARQRIEKCISDIRKFLHQNMLCNNSEKTELLIIGSSHQLRKLHVSSINVDNVEIRSTDNVRNLGVIFDNTLSMSKQVNKMCRNAYFNLRNIAQVRKCLSKEVTKTAINALVTPHLDYGNGLLYGISKRLENKLQVAQNSAVRLIERLKKHDHITEHRKNLHWLPIPARCQFKLMTTTWKALNNQAPEYLRQRLNRKVPTGCNLRSNSLNLLVVPRGQSSKIGKRAFSHSSPTLWNSLPDAIKNMDSLEKFKRHLKTHLFTQFYS